MGLILFKHHQGLIRHTACKPALRTDCSDCCIIKSKSCQAVSLQIEFTEEEVISEFTVSTDPRKGGKTGHEISGLDACARLRR